MTPSSLRVRAQAFLRALNTRASRPTEKNAGERPRRRLHVEGLEARIVPFKPYTHVAIAQEARLDAIDDGMITIEGREYAVNSEVMAAIRDYPEYFNAGTVGPDGFPDLIMGQGVIHPTNVGEWINHVLTSARNYVGPDRAQVLAWSHGFLSHVIGDMWAHTLVNEFSGGPFPDTGSVVSEQAALANALRHIIVEGYIGDATPGFDDNPNRTLLPSGDVSDVSTPGIGYAVPHAFIYNTFVRQGSGPAGNTTDKGAIINFFYGLRDSLRTAAGPRPVNPIDLLLSSFDNTKRAYDDFVRFTATPVVFFNPLDPNFDDAWAALANLGITSIADGLAAVGQQAANVLSAARFALYGHYLHAWADDIDTGLQHWSEFGLGLTNAMFNPQSKRNYQNSLALPNESEDDLDRVLRENAVGMLDVIMYELGDDFTQSAHGGQSFLENHLFSMLGAPDVLLTIGDRIGDFGAALGSLLDGFRAQFPQLDFIFNPITQGINAIKEEAKDLVKDVVGSALGIDFDQLEAILKSPSSRLDDTSINYLGQSIPLFHPDDHEKLDSYLGITNPNHHTGPGGILGDDVTFDRSKFAAYGNAVTMTKLSFLEGVVLDQLIGDLRGAPYVLYGPGNGNIMTTVLPGVADAVSNTQWILSADGDHAWRADRQPKTGDGKPGAGSGNFPLWESCLLRDSVFRVLFKDWENGTENFPDLGDDHSHDPNETPPVPTFNPATGELLITGSPQDDDLRITSLIDSGIAYISVSFPHTIYYCEETFNFPVADITKITTLGMGGNDSLTIDAVISKPIEFIGGDGVDLLNIDDSANTSAITGTLSSTTVTGLGVIPFGVTYDGTTEDLLLELGSGNDSFTVQSTNANTKVILNTAAGNDKVFVNSTSSELKVDMGAGTDLLVGDNLDRIYRIEGPGSGTVVGLVSGGFSGVENITAGSGIDQFLFVGGLIAGTINGGSGSDLIVGDNFARTFAINGVNSGNIVGLAGAFTNIENLTGGSAGDTFKFFPGGSIGGSIDGQGGIDRIDFSLINSQSVFLFDLGLVDGFDAFTPGLLPIGGYLFNINDLAGSTLGLGDALIGLNGDADWQLRWGAGQTNYTDVASGRQLTFGSVELLFGGSAVDRFTVDFSAGAPATKHGVTINGGGGLDRLNVVGSAGRDLMAAYMKQFNANGVPMRYSAIESIEARGGGGNDVFSAITGLPSIVKSLNYFGENGNDSVFVMPTVYTTMRLDGGAGVDSITVRPTGARYALPLPPRGAISGTWLFSNRRSISFVSFETRFTGVLQYAIY